MKTSLLPTDFEIVPNDDEHSGPERSPSRTRFVKPTPKLTVVIKGKDSNFKPWNETADVTSLSSGGAGFFLSRECKVGSLISLIMAMPPHLRRYDHDKRLYRTWGLVQYCYEASGEELSGFHVGVALIGKDAPESYLQNPAQSYRVAGMDRDGLWRITELETAFRQRGAVRFWNSIDASIYQLDGEQHSIATEKTVTENISETGASVFSDLGISVGDQIKFQTSAPPFSSLSIVRHKRIGPDDRTRVHLEFVENTFPILEIAPTIEEEGEH
jgi:hypothetical protein